MATPAPQFRDERRGRRKAVGEAGLITVEMNPVGFGLMLNVSRTGMSVFTLNRVQPGDQVQISFSPPRTTLKIEAIARVSWTADGNAGLHIHKIRRDSLEAMNSWIASLPDLPTSSQGIVLRGQRPVIETQIRAIEADIRVAGLSEPAALQLIAERMMSLTDASGSAIAMGTADHMVCRGSAGLSPEMGTEISSDSGLTGECIRTGKTIRCDDTETDTRVDRDACRQLNLRSSVIAPVHFDRKVRGVLEVFSPRVTAFDEQQLLLLEKLADLTSLLVYGRPPANVPAVPEPKASLPTEDIAPAPLLESADAKPDPGVLESEPENYLAIPNSIRRWMAPAIVVVILLLLVLGWQLLR